MQIIEEAVRKSQEPHETYLSPEDRRLLLGANLRLLCHRFTNGQRISQDDLLRMASLADDALEQAT